VTSIQMPQLGETIVEGTILKWLKQEGEHIDVDEPLFELSTDKVDTEVPSPVSGTVTKILVAEGTTVAVGTALAEVDSGDGAASADGDASGASAAADYSAAAQEPVAADAVGAAAPGSASAATPAAPSPDAPADAPAAAPSSPAETAADPPAPTAPVAVAPVAASLPDRGPRSQILSPLVRKLAEEHNLDLSQISGSGTGGRITKKDVMDAVAAGGTSTPAAAATPAPASTEAAPALQAVPGPVVAGGGEEIVPMTHIRKAIASHMLGSLQVTARAWNMVEVNMEHVVRTRQRVKEAFAAREGFSLTYTPFVTRAVTEALLTYPMVNSELRGEEIVVRHFVNMGVAVSYDDGLIVPVVKGADTMNLVGVARSINDLATRARAKKLKPDEVQGATFSITNPGPFGSILSVPIINTPNTAILAFDAIEKRPVVIDDAIAIRHMVYISMSWDHRVIDGALASQFLARVKENLETWDWAEDLGL
jgi:pyruvate dehydrogenase E2 component (dihydrolipoamide acetyltransferase)